MARRFHANNFSTTLNGSITNVQTTAVLTSVTGLPTIATGEVYRLTLDDGVNVEIVEVTSRSSFTVTITRGVEGTTGAAFASGTKVELRETADSIDRKQDKKGYTTTATAAGTTTLTVESNRKQYFTGSTTQTVVLPVTSTLQLGEDVFEIVNNSTGVVTVQSSGANTIRTVAASATLRVTCILTSGTTAASWDYEYLPNKAAAGVASFLNVPTTANLAAFLTDKIVQTVTAATGAVATGTTVMPFDDTIPQNTEGDQYLTVSITPTTATHLLMIRVVLVFSTGSSSQSSMALFQDSTANALAATSCFRPAINLPNTLVLDHVMTAGTTSSTTFNVRLGPSAADTITVNGAAASRRFGGVCASRITVQEIMA